MKTFEIVKFPTYGYGIRVTSDDYFTLLYSFKQNRLIQNPCINNGIKAIDKEFKCEDINLVKSILVEFFIRIEELEVYKETEMPS